MRIAIVFSFLLCVLQITPSEQLKCYKCSGKCATPLKKERCVDPDDPPGNVTEHKWGCLQMMDGKTDIRQCYDGANKKDPKYFPVVKRCNDLMPEHCRICNKDFCNGFKYPWDESPFLCYSCLWNCSNPATVACSRSRIETSCVAMNTPIMAFKGCANFDTAGHCKGLEASGGGKCYTCIKKLCNLEDPGAVNRTRPNTTEPAHVPKPESSTTCPTHVRICKTLFVLLTMFLWSW